MMSKQYYSFFLIIPPGLENLAHTELLNKASLLGANEITNLCLERGGISLMAPLEGGFHLNAILKIPTRILLRLDSFKCRDFPRLFKKISKFKWADYLNGFQCEIHVSSQTSRLLNTTKIKQTVTEAIGQYFKANTPSQKMLEKKIEFLPQIFIRVVNDLVTLSIDTTGERLNIRNYRTHTGFAPIRENIAAALVFSLNAQNGHLVDPMCGSGTFLLEAATFYELNARTFSFHSFNISAPLPLLPINHHPQSDFLSYQGLDLNAQAIACAKNNLGQLLNPLPIDFITHDLFCPRSFNFKEDIFVITNPPYGKRIRIKENLHNYFQNIINAIYKTYAPAILGIIIPQNINYKKLHLSNYQLRDVITFSNGGIKVNFLILKKN